MTVSPLPRHGIAIEGRDRPGRVLRVSSHPEADRAVLSIWDDNVCRATVRLAPADVAELIGSLAQTLAESGARAEPLSDAG